VGISAVIVCPLWAQDGPALVYPGTVRVAPDKVCRLSNDGTTNQCYVWAHYMVTNSGTATVTFKVRAPDNSTETTLVSAGSDGTAGSNGAGTLRIQTSGSHRLAFIPWNPADAITTGDYDLYFSVSQTTASPTATVVVTDAYADNLDELEVVDNTTWNTYYVNDTATTSDMYASAAGAAYSSTQTGKTPALAVTKVRAIIDNYALDTGDVIFVDTGTYIISSGTANRYAFTLSDDGTSARDVYVIGSMRINCPGMSTYSTVDGNQSGDYMFHLDGADYITIDSFEIKNTVTGASGVGIGIAHADALYSEVYRCRITDCEYGLYIYASAQGLGGGGDFKWNRSDNNEKWGAYLVRVLLTTWEGNVFYANNDENMYLDNSSTSTYPITIQGNTMYNGASSGTYPGCLILDNTSLSVVIKDNILMETTNDEWCLYIETGSSGTNTYNDTYHSADSNDRYGGVAAAGTGDINSDPSFVSTTVSSENFHLKSTSGRYTEGVWSLDASNSACIDVADSASTYSTELEDNGDRRNMGAFGNTKEASKGDTGTTNQWTGDVSEDWDDNGNWGHGKPGTSDDNNGNAEVVSVSRFAPRNNANNACYKLTITSGTLTIADTDSDYYLDVGAGGVVMNGGTLSMAGTDGSDVPLDIDLEDPPEQILCAGNWNDSSGTFQATGGEVELDGGTQTITAGAANYFYELDISASSASTKTLASDIECKGTLEIVSASATFAPSTYTIEVAGNWSDSTGVFQPTAGTVTFHGSSAQTITAGAANNFYNVQFGAASGTGTKTLAAAIDVNGNLTIYLDGATKTALSAANYTIEVAGNWTNDGVYARTSSATVIFDGSGNQNINGKSQTIFRTLTIANTGANDTYSVTITSTTDVKAYTVNVNDGRFHLDTDDSLIHQNTSTVSTSGALMAGSLNTSRTLTVASGAELRLAGTSAADKDAVIEGSSVKVTIDVTGTLRAKSATFSNLDTSGIVINDGGTLRDLTDCLLVKYNTSTAGPCVNIAGLTGADRSNLPWSIKGVIFSSGSSSTVNVQADQTTPFLYVYDFRSFAETAAATAETRDDDDYDRVEFKQSIIKNVTTSTSYDSLQDAVDGAAASDVVRCVKWIPITETVTTSTNFTLENCLFTSIAPASGDDSFIYSSGGVLRNCVFTGGDATARGLQNCTFRSLPPNSTSASAYTATGSTSFKNGLVGTGYTTSGTLTTTLTSVADSKWVDPLGLDFHLASADDGGTDSSSDFTTDFEGQTRSGSWDRGADEYVSTAYLKYVSMNSTSVADYGHIRQFVVAGKRTVVDSSTWFGYVGGGDGSALSAREGQKRFALVNLDTMLEKASITVPGEIMGFTSFGAVDSSSEYRRYVFLALDTGSDGYADSVHLVVDRQTTATGFSLTHPTGALNSANEYDRRFGSTTVGSKYVYRPEAMGKLKYLTSFKLSGEGTGGSASSPSYTRKLFTVVSSNSTAKLCKVNADASDTTDDTYSRYGWTIWKYTNSELTYQAPIQLTTKNDLFWAPMVGTTPQWHVAMRIATTGGTSTTPSVSKSIESNTDSNENTGGHVIDLLRVDVDTGIVVAPNDGKRMFAAPATPSSSGGGTKKWTLNKNGSWSTAATYFGGTAVGMPYRHAGENFYFHATKVPSLEKVLDMGKGATSFNGTTYYDGLRIVSSTDPGGSGGAFPYTTLEWPVTTNLISNVAFLYFGTSSHVYAFFYRRKIGSTGTEGPATGYPMRVVHPTTYVSLVPVSGAQFAYFTTRGGRVVRIPLQ